MKYPKYPGVYWFLDKTKQVLYVGKAKNLNNRLKSYKRLNDQSPKTLQLIKVTKSTKFLVTDSEFEALILEAKLIQAYQPRYNILLKNKQSPLYLTFTHDVYPRILKTRGQGDYGPYPSVAKLSYILKILRKIFLYCDHPDTNKPCFYYHLKLCSGACCQKISPVDYRRSLTHLKLFLSGKTKALIRRLQKQQKKAAKTLDFEEAAVYHRQILAIASLKSLDSHVETELPQLTEDKTYEQIIALQRLLKTNLPLDRIEAYDISNLQGKNPTGSMVVFINGQKSPADYRYFKIKSLDTPNDLKMLAEVLQRRVNHPEWGIPNLILIDGGKNQVKIAQKIIPWNIPIIGLAKHPDRVILRGLSLQADPANPGLHLLQALRDEAHRFARKLHLKLRLHAYEDSPRRLSIS